MCDADKTNIESKELIVTESERMSERQIQEKQNKTKQTNANFQTKQEWSVCVVSS